MLRLRRSRAALVAAVTLALLPTAAMAATDHRRARILGSDGVEYESAPLIIEGTHDDLYFGLEYDYACALSGEQFEKGLRRLARLARVIEQSGRRALFTVAPAKADIVRRDLPPSMRPQGSCDTQGLNAQRRVLNTFPDPDYVSARRVVASDPRQTYWKTDLHWSAIGASDYTVALAGKLDPRLAHRQRYRKVTKTQVGFLNYLRQLDEPETMSTVEYAGRVDVHTAADSPEPVGSGGVDVRWNSTPARRTWPGHTLLLGDSFTTVGLESLGPLFRHGRFLWNQDDNDKEIAKGIAASDTVVMEVYQTFLVGSPLGSASLRKELKKELRRHPAHSRTEP